MEQFLDLFQNLIHKAWETEPAFVVKVAAIVIILVFIATFISNHCLKWRCFLYNKKQGNVLFEIEDSISGFKMKPVPLKREKVPIPMRRTLSSQIAAIVWKKLRL